MLYDLIVLDEVSDDFLRQVRNFIDEWNSNSITIKVKTSGSTGEPKVLSLEKERVRASALATGKYFGFEREQMALLNLSPDYIAGKLMIVRAIEYEMKLAVAPLVANPLLNIPDIKIDFAAFVPSQIVSILSETKSRNELNSIKNVIIGGAPLDSNIENELTQMNSRMYASFGMTIYRCLEGFSIGIDERSCLIVHQNKIVRNELVTNDVIDFIDENTFKWCGRYDNVINSSGVKIHPEKVEKMIAHLLPDKRFYVTSKKDEEYGEVAVLVVEGGVDNPNILEDAKASLPKHHAPKELIIEEKLEETPTQKIIRKRF